MVKNAQIWLNSKYSTNEKKAKAKSLSINSLNKYWPFALYGGGKDGDYYFRSGEKELERELDLTGFTSLENLCIRQQEISSIGLGSHNNLTEIVISGTLIKGLDLGSQPSLVSLSISDANRLLFLDLSQNTNLFSLLVEHCKLLERIDGLDKLVKLLFSSVVKGNAKLNSSDYERFCIPDRPWSNIGLPQGWQDFFNRHAEEINSKPKKAAWLIAVDNHADAEKVWNNGWHDFTANSPENGRGSFSFGGTEEDGSEEETENNNEVRNEGENYIYNNSNENFNIMVSAQQWLDNKYLNKKQTTNFLNITTKGIMGGNDEQEARELLITDFPVLEEIVINRQSNISKVIIRNCPLLSSLNLLDNSSLSSVDISDLNSLNSLSIDENSKPVVAWPIKREKVEFEKQLNDKNNQIENLKKQLRELKKVEKDLRDNLGAVKDDKKSLESLKKQLISEMGGLREKVVNLEDKLNSKSRELEQIKDEQKETKKKLKEAEKKLREIDGNKFTENEKKLRDTFLSILNLMLNDGLQENNLPQIKGKINELRNLNLFGNPNLGDLPLTFSETVSTLLGQYEERKTQSQGSENYEEEPTTPNWFRIREIWTSPSYIKIKVNKTVKFQNSNNETQICLVNRYPFNQYRLGNWVEIDLDRLASKNSSENLDDVSLVRKVSLNRKSLLSWRQENKITEEEKNSLLSMADIGNSPEFSLSELKKVVHYRKLVETNRRKMNIDGTIHRVILFSTWFNPNCALIVSGDSAPLSISLLIYEFPVENIPEIFEFVKFSEGYSSETEIKSKLCDIEEKLNGKNPVLYAPLEHSYDNGYRFNNVKEFTIPLSDDFKNNPDKYIKPLSVIKNWTGSGRLGHGAVYLGKKKICHENGGRVVVDNWVPNSEIVYYHPFIPFKTNEKIVEHMAKAVEGVANYYSRGGAFNSENNNCEHFCNKSVYGVNISEQVEMAKFRRNMVEKVKKIDNLKEKLEENDKFFSGLTTDEVAENRIKEIIGLISRDKTNNSQDFKEAELETYIEITPKSNWKIN